MARERNYLLFLILQGTMAEWLTREIRNLFLSEGAGSNPAGVVFWPRKGAKIGEEGVEDTPKNLNFQSFLCGTLSSLSGVYIVFLTL